MQESDLVGYLPEPGANFSKKVAIERTGQQECRDFSQCPGMHTQTPTNQDSTLDPVSNIVSTPIDRYPTRKN